MSSEHARSAALPSLLAWLVLLLMLGACDEQTTNLVSDPATTLHDAAARDAAARDASLPRDAAVGGARDASTGPHVPALCGSAPCACDDGVDSDGDTLVDGLDPECTGPFDDDEESFATGSPIPANRCRDCFWDSNAGSGDDGCRYPAECLLGQEPGNNGNCSSCTVSAGCITSCAARTPNGCDCFGCCDITRADGSSVSVSLNDACSLANLDDEKACPRCIQNSECSNPCGRCELCPGRKSSDLPADCAGASGDDHVCDDGEQVCSSSTPCSDTRYCQLGCCLPTLF